jgi:hypothetical protein
VKNSLLSSLMVTQPMRLPTETKLSVTGIGPFVAALARAFEALRNASATEPILQEVYSTVKSAGGLCCRPIKKPGGVVGKGYSNHSWGTALDLYFGSRVDKRGDGKSQRGIQYLAAFMNQQKIYWAGTSALKALPRPRLRLAAASAAANDGCSRARARVRARARAC